MRRTKEEALETRALILESALDIFSAKNFENTSITEIAQRAGLSKGAVYWHFKNKNDLLVQLVESICRNGEDDLRRVFELADSDACLRTYYKKALTKAFENHRYQKIHKMMLRRRYEWPEDVQNKVRRLITDSSERDREMVELLIVRGQKNGKIRKDVSAKAVAVLISSIFFGLSVMQLSDKLPKEFPSYTDILFDAFDRELSANGYLITL